MRYDGTLCRNDKLLLASKESITPNCTTSLLISDIFFSGDLAHHLLEIEMTTIEKESYHSIWYSEVG